MSKDYYAILGIDKNASPEEIKKAFRKKAHEYHPDKGGDAEKFKEVNEANQVLGNPEKKKQYDQFGSAFQNGQAGGGFGAGAGGFSGFQNTGDFNMNFEDLGDMFGGFGDIFGFNGGRQSSHQKNRGRDLEMPITLDFLEAAHGLEKELIFNKNVICAHCQGNGAEPGSKIDACKTCRGSGQVTRLQRTILGNIQAQTTCPDCGGEGKIYSKKCSVCRGSGIHNEQVKIKVKIPAGINDGESIRLSGQGEAGPQGSPAGDLYLRLRLRANQKFRRQNYDVYTEETISVSQAILGDKIDVETVNGLVKLKIPAGTQAGTVFKLRGKGISRLHNNGLGDQFTKIIVKIPTKLDKKQKQLLAELNI